jgi:hypothetical protein
MIKYRLVQSIFFGILLLLIASIGNFASAQDNNLPDWFKNNAKWWNEDLISDQEIINAIENLIENDIILVELPSSNPTNAVEINQRDQSIPNFVKDVFGFWGADLVSDSEIGNSLQYLIKQNIIRSEKISEKKTILAQSNSEETTYPEILQELFAAQKYNEIIAANILGINSNPVLDSKTQDIWEQIQGFVQSAKERANRAGISEEMLQDVGKKIPEDEDDDWWDQKWEEIDNFNRNLENNESLRKEMVGLSLEDWKQDLGVAQTLGILLEHTGYNIEFNHKEKQVEPDKLIEPISGINSVLGDLDPICFDGMCLKSSSQDAPVVDTAKSTVCVKDKCFTTVKKPEKENISKRYVTTGGMQLDSGNCDYPACASIWFKFTHSDSQVDRLLLNFTAIDPDDGFVLPGIKGKIYVTCDMDGKTFEIIPETVDVGDNEEYVGGTSPYNLILPCQEDMVPSSNNESKQDTDGDGINNLDELKIHRTDPLKKDTDGDGINDSDEIKLGLNPTKQDTDGDGIEDGIDEDPKKFSNVAFDKNPNGSYVHVKIIDRNQNHITIQKINDTEVNISVDFLRDNYDKVISGGKSVTVEVLGILLELEFGTSINTSFG